MRTTGNFAKIYQQAKNYFRGIDCDQPHNPVVRLEGDNKWMIESALEPTTECSVECTLDEFDSWFCESYEDAMFEIDDSVEREFVNAFTDRDE